MNIIIIEDEYLTANRIKKLLEEINPDYHVITIIRSVKQGLEWFSVNEEPDLVLSDIELGDGNCFQIFSEYTPQAPILFLTAYNQYAIHAFKLNTIGYILKPIRKKDIETNLEKFKSLTINNINNPLVKKENNAQAENTSQNPRFLVKNGINFTPVSASNIILFYSEFNLTYIITKNLHKYILDHSLGHLASILDPKHYFRISRSFIIADYAIKNVKKYERSRLLVELTEDIPLDIIVSRRNVTAFKKWLEKN